KRDFPSCLQERPSPLGPRTTAFVTYRGRASSRSLALSRGGSSVGSSPTAEADRGRHPGFPSFNVLAGGPGRLALAFDAAVGRLERRVTVAAALAPSPRVAGPASLPTICGRRYGLRPRAGERQADWRGGVHRLYSSGSCLLNKSWVGLHHGAHLPDQSTFPPLLLWAELRPFDLRQESQHAGSGPAGTGRPYTYRP